jgi:hypothetical protein
MKNSISKCWRYSARVLHYWFNINANLCLHSNAVLKQAFVCGDVTEHAAATRAQARLRATYEGLPSEAKRRLAVDVSVAGREGQVCGPRVQPGQRAHTGQCTRAHMRREAEASALFMGGRSEMCLVLCI